MSENSPKEKSRRAFSTKTLVSLALLSALSIVLARLIIPMPSAVTRFSIEAVPVGIAGLLFGPLAGALTGFVSDTVGCLFSGYGWNPLFTIPPILYGLIPGLLRSRYAVQERVSYLKLLLMFGLAAVIGSWLWQSYWLSFFYGTKTYGAFLVSRGIQFAVTVPLDALIVWLLFKTGVFRSLHLWPPKSVKKEV